MCPTTKDGAAFLSEAHTILGEFRSRFAALPASSALRQPCKWPGSDETIDSWLSLLERVLDEGLPTLGGDRFDRSVYGLSSEPANGLRIQRVGEQPTFFGSYPPPDDLDGQCIDLVAIAATDAAPVRVTARPRLRLQENMASFAEIRAMQNSQQDNTTLGALGLLPTEFGAVAPGAGIELDGRDGAVAKPLDQKVVISDHVPISFELHRGERHFTVLSMNLLANAYISYCTISDVFYTFQEPEVALFRPIEMDSINYTGAIMLGALHAYHTVAYWSEITAADVFHHVTFVPFNQIAIFWPVLANWESMGLQWGSNINMINFFTCGLPGGLDYLFLGLVKNKKMDKMTHKRLQAIINAWLRGPGIIASVTVCLFEGLRNWEKSPTGGKVIPIICFVLIGYNGIHYMERVVLSAGKNVDGFRGTS